MKATKKSSAKEPAKKASSKNHSTETKSVKESVKKPVNKKNLAEKKNVDKTGKKPKKREEKSSNLAFALLAILFIALGLFFLAYFQPDSNGDVSLNEENTTQTNFSSEVLASVDGEEITLEEVMNIVEMSNLQGAQVSMEDALDQAIIVLMLSQEAERSNLMPGIEETEQMIEVQLEQTGSSIEELKEHISLQGISYNKLVEDFRKQVGIQTYLELELSNINLNVSDEEAIEFYDTYAELEELPPFEELEAEIKQIIVNEKQQEAINNLINEVRESKEIVFY